MAKKFYAVRGDKIYNSWDECKSAVSGVSGAVYKGFATMEDAEKFMLGDESSNSKPSFYAVRGVGIFKSWGACQEVINGMKGAEFRKFSDEASADAWLNGVEDRVWIRDGVFFFGEKNKFAVILVENGKEIAKVFSSPNTSMLEAEYLAGVWLKKWGYAEAYCCKEYFVNWVNGVWQCRHGFDLSRLPRLELMTDTERGHLKNYIKRKNFDGVFGWEEAQ